MAISRLYRALLAASMSTAVLACGLAGVDEDGKVGGRAPPGGASSGEDPAARGGSSGAPATSSGDTASPEAGVDAAPPDPCHFDFSGFDCAPGHAVYGCDGVEPIGDANGVHHRLTSAGLDRGALWIRTDPGSMRQFAVDYELEVAANGSASVGNGFAFPFLTHLTDAGAPALPQLAPTSGHPTLGISALRGAEGTAVFWRTFHPTSASLGAFFFDQTDVPSSEETRPDNWDGPRGSSETFAASAGTRVRVHIEHAPADGQQARVTFARSSGAGFVVLGDNSGTFPLPERIELVGVTANTGHAAAGTDSAQIVRSFVLDCSP